MLILTVLGVKTMSEFDYKTEYQKKNLRVGQLVEELAFYRRTLRLLMEAHAKGHVTVVEFYKQLDELAKKKLSIDKDGD